jgi:hypothetical protein
MTLLVKAQEWLRSRTLAYRRVFLDHGIDTDIVLQDLAKFCRAHESTFHADARVSALMEGRREVWTRIVHHLKLTDDQLWDIYGNKSLTKETPHV